MADRASCRIFGKHGSTTTNSYGAIEYSDAWRRSKKVGFITVVISSITSRTFQESGTRNACVLHERKGGPCSSVLNFLAGGALNFPNRRLALKAMRQNPPLN